MKNKIGFKLNAKQTKQFYKLQKELLEAKYILDKLLERKNRNEKIY